MKGNFKLQTPSIGFFSAAAAFVFAIVATILFFNTYAVGGYTLSRWAVTCSIIAVWLLAFLSINTLLVGEKPFWTNILYGVVAFLLTYGLLQFLQPCLTPIGFAFGSSDLNMGDSALNKVVAVQAVITAVFYLLAIIGTIVSSFVASTKVSKAKRGTR